MTPPGASGPPPPRLPGPPPSAPGSARRCADRPPAHRCVASRITESGLNGMFQASLRQRARTRSSSRTAAVRAAVKSGAANQRRQTRPAPSGPRAGDRQGAVVQVGHAVRPDACAHRKARPPRTSRPGAAAANAGSTPIPFWISSTAPSRSRMRSACSASRASTSGVVGGLHRDDQDVAGRQLRPVRRRRRRRPGAGPPGVT